jgi:hypothetical protein
MTPNRGDDLREFVAARVRWLLARVAAASTLDTRSLAASRIGLGLLLLADALLRTRDFRLMFAADGIFPVATLQRFNGDVSVWSLAFLVDATWWSGVILAAEGTTGVLLAIGLWLPWTTVAAWIALVSVLRRTAPATNAGDAWLACQLFWSMFLPLAACWSLDARKGIARFDARKGLAGFGVRRAGGTAALSPPLPTAVCSIASAALVLQIAAVYGGAGLSKCNASWFSGEALARALSVHDHGTAVGMALAHASWIMAPVTWLVLAAELAVPVLLLAWPTPRIRLLLVVAFMLFHGLIWATMSVGLFAAIGIVAWVPLIPGAVWDWCGLRHAIGGQRVTASLAGWPAVLCGAALIVAGVSFIHTGFHWPTTPLPRPVVWAINAGCLVQNWGMFGDVPPQEQWVYGRGLCSDGREVDVLRAGRPLQTDRPDGGFSSLPHHRWHKLFWVLPRPHMRVFSAGVAEALAREWNAAHGPADRIVSLEIRFARRGSQAQDSVTQEVLVASWPPRDPAGVGSLERFLEDAGTATENAGFRTGSAAAFPASGGTASPAR